MLVSIHSAPNPLNAYQPEHYIFDVTAFSNNVIVFTVQIDSAWGHLVEKAVFLPEISPSDVVDLLNKCTRLKVLYLLHRDVDLSMVIMYVYHNSGIPYGVIIQLHRELNLFVIACNCFYHWNL